MAIILNSDHEAAAIGKLLEQFKSSPNLLAWMGSYLDQVQLVEQGIVDIFAGLDLDTAVGADLDRIGAIVGEARGNYDDDQYRLNLRARVLINKSNGSAANLLELLTLLTESSTGLAIALPTVTDTIKRFEVTIDKTLPAGVDLNLLFYYICQAAEATSSFGAVIQDTTGDTALWDVDDWDDATALGATAVEVTQCISPAAGGYLPTAVTDITPPTVTVVPDSGTVAASASLDYTVTYTDAVGLATPALVSADLTVGGTAGGGVTGITGSNPFTVTVDNFTTAGTTALTVKTGSAYDTYGNTNAATTSSSVTVEVAGVDALPNLFTYDSVDTAALVAFRGSDAGASTWTAAVGATNLSATGGGTSIGLTTFPNGGGAVQFNGGEYFNGGDVYDLTTGVGQKVVIEIIFEPGTGGVILDKMGGSTGVGNHWLQNSTTDFRGRLENTSSGRNAIDGTSDFTGWKYHVVALDDATNTLVSYDGENGVTSTRTDFTGSASFDSAASFTLGAFSGGSSNFDGKLAWVAVYEVSNLDLTTTADLVTACEARYTAIGGTPGSPL